MQRSSQNGGILSRLALHFPLIFSFWGRHNQQQVGTGKQTEVFPHEVMSSDDIDERTNRITSDNIDNNLDKYYEEPALRNNSSKLPTSRFSLSSLLTCSFLFIFLSKIRPAISLVFIFASEL